MVLCLFGADLGLVGFGIGLGRLGFRVGLELV